MVEKRLSTVAPRQLTDQLNSYNADVLRQLFDSGVLKDALATREREFSAQMRAVTQILSSQAILTMFRDAASEPTSQQDNSPTPDGDDDDPNP